MQVTETEMSNGDRWSFELAGSTPQTAVLERLNEAVDQFDGFVCVFDTATDNPSLDNALFTGRIVQTRGRLGFAGYGLASLIQTPDDLGRHDFGATTATAEVNSYQSWTLATWIDEVLGTSYNGITKSTITLTGLGSFESWWIIGLGGIEVIQAGCAMASTVSSKAVWKIDPAGTFTAGPRATIFPTFSTPEVIVTSDISVGNEPVRPVRGRITGLFKDASQITSQVIAVGAGSGLFLPVVASSSQNVARGLDGNFAVIRRVVDLSQTDTTTTLSDLAAQTLAEHEEVTRTYEVTAFDPVRPHVTPGDSIYVFDPMLEASDDADIQYQGQSIRPVKTIVRTMTWSTHPDQGVWMYRPGEAAADQWTDLTDYVVHPDVTETRMVVGDVDIPVVSVTGPETFVVTSPRRTVLPPGSDAGLSNERVEVRSRFSSRGRI